MESNKQHAGPPSGTNDCKLEYTVVAYLVNYGSPINERGDLMDTVCPTCCEKYGWTGATRIYHVNIYPYRAVCHECDKELIVNASVRMPCLFGSYRPHPCRHSHPALTVQQAAGLA